MVLGGRQTIGIGSIREGRRKGGRVGGRQIGGLSREYLQRARRARIWKKINEYENVGVPSRVILWGQKFTHQSGLEG